MMMRHYSRIVRNDVGAGAVEFAIVAPILIMALVGIFQLGILFFANAGLKSAVGEGARLATLYPRPSDSRIMARISDKRFGISNGRVSGPTITHGRAASRNYIDIKMSYAVPLDFLFFTAAPIELEETRRVFVQPI